MKTKIYLGCDKRSTKHPYYVRWYGTPDPDTGEQKPLRQQFVTKEEAELFMAEKEVDQKKGKSLDKPTDISLAQFCNDFLEVKCKNRIGTIELYQNTIDHLLSSKLFDSGLAIRRITPRLADKFAASLKPKSGNGNLSTSARHRIIRNCTHIFKRAVDWGYIEKNPFAKVERPKVVTRPWHYLTPKEYHKLLTVADDLRTKALYALCYTAGLRLGEATSLLWADIDLDKGEVTIRNRKATPELPPFDIKDHEQRTIPLPSHTISLLTELQADRLKSGPFVVIDAERYARIQDKWQECRQNSATWRNRDMLNNVLRHFKEHLKAAGIEPAPGERLAIHDLRKACVLNWSKVNRNPKVTQVWAGHSDLATTMKYYSQVTNDQREAAVKALDAMLSVA